MKVTVKYILVGEQGTVPKGLEKTQEGLEIKGLAGERDGGWWVGFYGISTFVGYLTLNPFLCK